MTKPPFKFITQFSVTRKGCALRVGLVMITPLIAMQLLRSNPHNKRLKDHMVHRLVRKIAEGSWSIYPAIVFTESGIVADAQHRLWAVVESGKSVECLVIWGIPDAKRNIFDEQTKNDAERIKMLDGTMTEGRSFISVVKGFYSYPHGQTTNYIWSETVLQECLSKCRKYIDPIYRICGTHKAPSIAAMARAMQHIGEDRMVYFASRLADGEKGASYDITIRKLRDWLMMKGGYGGGGVLQMEAYLRTQTAIIAWSEKKVLKALRRGNGDHFPILPEIAVDIQDRIQKGVFAKKQEALLQGQEEQNVCTKIDGKKSFRSSLARETA